MRKLIFGLLLLLPVCAWAGVGYAGATQAVVAKYTTAKVVETGDYACYVNLAGMPQAWWAACTSATNIVPTDSANTAKKKYVEAFNATTKTGFVWFLGSLNTSTGGYVRIQAGLPVNIANNGQVFTDCGIANRYGMEEASGNVTDAAGGATGTANALTYGTSAIIGKGFTFVRASSSNFYNADAGNFEYTQPYTVSVWYKRNSKDLQMWTIGRQSMAGVYPGWHLGFSTDNYMMNGQWNEYNAKWMRQFSADTMVSVSSWQWVAITNSGTGTVAGGKMYKNGDSIATTDVSHSLGTNSILTTGKFCVGGADASAQFYDGILDEARVYTEVKSRNYLITDYNLQAHSFIPVYVLQDSGAVNDGPVIGTQPITDTVCAGETASFSVAATGTGTLHYTWILNATDTVGTDASTYSIVTTTANDSNRVHVFIRDTNGTSHSDTTRIIVLGVGVPSYATSPVMCSTGVAMSQGLTITGCAMDSANVSPALPAGITLNKLSGTISGTPTAAATKAGYMVKVFKATGNDSCYDTITVICKVKTMTGRVITDTIGNRGIYGHVVASSGTVDSTKIIGSWPDSTAMKAYTTKDTVAFHWTAKKAKAGYTIKRYNACDSLAIFDTITILGPSIAYSASNTVDSSGYAITPRTPVSMAMSDSVTFDSLPVGLSVNKTTGVISGLPTTAAAQQIFMAYTWRRGVLADSTPDTITIAQGRPQWSWARNPLICVVGTAVARDSAIQVAGTVLDSLRQQSALPDSILMDNTTGTLTGWLKTKQPIASYTVRGYSHNGADVIYRDYAIRIGVVGNNSKRWLKILGY